MTEIRTYIVAPSPLVRSGLRALLDSDTPHVEVVGESDELPDDDDLLSGAEVAIIAGDDALGNAPPNGHGHLSFVLLADDGERAVSWLRDASPFGWGVLSPDSSPEEVGAAILAAANGLVVLPREFAEEMVESGEIGAGTNEPSPEPLTVREREVLGLLAKGFPNKTIARELYISEHTVKFHLSSIFAKLDVSSRAGAVSRGAHFGLVSL